MLPVKLDDDIAKGAHLIKAVAKTWWLRCGGDPDGRGEPWRDRCARLQLFVNSFRIRALDPLPDPSHELVCQALFTEPPLELLAQLLHSVEQEPAFLQTVTEVLEACESLEEVFLPKTSTADEEFLWLTPLWGEIVETVIALVQHSDATISTLTKVLSHLSDARCDLTYKSLSLVAQKLSTCHQEMWKPTIRQAPVAAGNRELLMTRVDSWTRVSPKMAALVRKVQADLCPQDAHFWTKLGELVSLIDAALIGPNDVRAATSYKQETFTCNWLMLTMEEGLDEEATAVEQLEAWIQVIKGKDSSLRVSRPASSFF